MSLWAIAVRGLRVRALSTVLTGVSLALGVMLIVCVLVVYGVVAGAFERNASLGYDVIVGAKGGRLQLVLNTVYHLSTPVENIPYSYFQEFVDGEFAPYVDRAIPYCLGDNYRGDRVVGTVPGLFEVEYAPGRRHAIAEGRNMRPDGAFEAVVGAVAARRAGLTVGDRFRPTHGVEDDGQGHEHEDFIVVGVLAPTGTPNDRALFVNIEGFYLLDGHTGHDLERTGPDRQGEEGGHDHGHHHEEGHPAHHDHAGHDHHEDHDHAGHDHAGHDHADPNDHGHEHDQGEPAAAVPPDDHDHEGHDGHDHAPVPAEQREVTAILVRTASPAASALLPNRINEGPVAQAVSPAREIRALFEEIVGPIQWALLGLAALVVVVAAVGILVSLVNSMGARRREIAVMRALGARRRDVLTIVLLESLLLGVAGGASGWLLGHALLGVVGPMTAARTGIAVGPLSFAAAELAILPLVALLATLAGYLPARMAYRTDVARALGSSS